MSTPSVAVSIVVEASSPAVVGGRLVESIGLETQGGVFTPLLMAGCDLPCEVTEIFSTAEDYLGEIRIFLYRGSSPRVIGNHFLGDYAIGGVPRAALGVPRIHVRLKASDRGITLTAYDFSGSQLTLVRRDQRA